MIPAKYNLRNLRVRWVTTLMTVLGTGLVVWATVLSFGLAAGLEHALSITGNDLDLIVLRKGSEEETSSGIEQRLARQVATLDGIARDADGQPMCSVEFVTILTNPAAATPGPRTSSSAVWNSRAAGCGRSSASSPDAISSRG